MSGLSSVSNFDKFEVVKTGFITATRFADSTIGTDSVLNNLDFVPAYVAFIYYESIDVYIQLPWHSFSGTTGALLEKVELIVFNGGVTLNITCPTSSSSYGDKSTYTVKYFLMRYVAS